MNKYLIHIRRFCYIAVDLLGKLIFLREERGIVAFCYHSIAKDSWKFSSDPERFKAHMQQLLSKRHPLTAEDLIEHLSGTKKAAEPGFLVTFDDGYKDILSLKQFCLDKKIKPIVFLIANPHEVVRKELDTDRELLTVDQVRELIAAGWEIGCHSMTHPSFKSLSSASVYVEIVEAKRRLEADFGVTIRCFAYPKGVCSPELQEVVKTAGYKIAFSIEDGFLSSKTNQFFAPRLCIDRSHSEKEIESFTSPLVVIFRKLARTAFSTVGI